MKDSVCSLRISYDIIYTYSTSTNHHGKIVCRRLLLVVLRSQGGISLEADGVDTDETVGIGRVVVKGVTTTFNVHGGKVGIVQGLGRGTSSDNDIALVEFHFDDTRDVALGEVNGVTDQVHFRGEPETVVAKTGEFGRQAFGDALDFTVHGDTLQVQVGSTEEGTSGGLVDTTTLDSDEAVFDNVDTANSVLAGKFIAVQEEVQSVSLLGLIVQVGDLGGDSLDEFDADLLRCVGSFLGGLGHLEHGVLGSAHGVLQHTTLVRGVEKVLVDRVVGLGLGVDRNSVLGAVGEQVGTSLEALNEFGITPGGDALDGGLERLGAHFETDLVVTLSGGTVGNVGGAFLVGNSDHFLRNAWSGNGSTEQVSALVNGIALDGFKDVVLNKVLAKVGNDALTGTARDGLGLDGGEVFFVLTDVGAESDHVESFLTQPLENDGGIETTGVGKDKLGLGFTHFGIWCVYDSEMVSKSVGRFL